MTDPHSLDPVRAYYETWTHGADRFDRDGLTAVLAPDVLLETPIAGRERGPARFVQGVARFAQTVRSFRLLHELRVGNEVAVLYECELTTPPGTHQFAEFFRVDAGRIHELRLVFDASGYRKPAG